MKFLNHSGEETIPSILLATGSTLVERIVNNVKRAIYLLWITV